MATGPQLSRRAFLSTSALAGLGGLFHPAVAAELLKKQKRAILVWMSGGPSQLETWDPKPGRPTAGPHGTTATSVPGLYFDEHMPRLTRLADRMVVVRSMTSKIAEHVQATVSGMTGSPPNRGPAAPLWQSVCAKELVGDEAVWPAFVTLGKAHGRDEPRTGGGFLGPRYDPVPCAGDGKPPEGLPTSAADVETVRRRHDLRDKLGADFGYGHDEGRLAAHDNTFRQVRGLLDRRGLFDLSSEPFRRVERYGDSPLGRDCLLACRLVEHGVPFVRVCCPLLEWDLHARLKEQQAITARFDTAVGAMVDDLIARGLWEHTLVVLMGEFGRTPRQSRAGRDHWSKCWSMSFGGAKARGGVVVGETDENGEEVKDRPVTVRDLLVTFYEALGVDPHKEVDVQGRPTPYVDRGTGAPIHEAL
jgi:Protein of unknown function (DUF1501)